MTVSPLTHPVSKGPGDTGLGWFHWPSTCCPLPHACLPCQHTLLPLPPPHIKPTTQPPPGCSPPVGQHAGPELHLPADTHHAPEAGVCVGGGSGRGGAGTQTDSPLATPKPGGLTHSHAHTHTNHTHAHTQVCNSSKLCPGALEALRAAAAAAQHASGPPPPELLAKLLAALAGE
jgi:hypothetical protein